MHAPTSTSDRVFHALGDATRRTIVMRLGDGPAAVSDLARPLPISLAAVLQHVQVLEASGLVTTRKRGRVRTCHLNPATLLEAERWLAQRRALWEGRLGRLEALIHAGPPTAVAQTTAPLDGPATAPIDGPTEEEPA